MSVQWGKQGWIQDLPSGINATAYRKLIMHEGQAKVLDVDSLTLFMSF